MGRPAALSRDRIADAAAAIVVDEGADALSARRLGAALGCDPSAVYRHFRTMDELRRVVGDLVLADVDVSHRVDEPWHDAVRRVCVSLRGVLLARRHLASLVQGAPTRLPNEVRITEALLAALLRGGLAPADAAAAYHAVIEYTIGSAVIDAEVQSLDDGGSTAAYEQWRRDYRALGSHAPAINAVAGHLYRGDAATRFEHGLDALVRGLASRA